MLSLSNHMVDVEGMGVDTFDGDNGGDGTRDNEESNHVVVV